MKFSKHILILFIFIVNNLISQTTDVVTGITLPTAITIVGNDMYYGSFLFDLEKINLNTPNNSQVVSSSDGIYRSLLHGNDLYFTEFYSDKISKIDITASNPTTVNISSEAQGSRPAGLVIKNNILYYSLLSSNKICKIDLNASTLVSVDVVTTNLNGPTGIAIIGNYLYIAEINGNKISKIDLTSNNPVPTDVVTGLINPTEIIVYGNDLLVSEKGADKIIKIDVSGSTPVTSTIVSNVSEPTGLFIKGTDLYISEYGNNKIVKFSLSTSTSGLFESKITNNEIKLFPNPSSDFITITGVENKTDYIICNSIGAEISRGSITNNNKIDIKSLIDGVYFIKLNNHMVRFNKQ
jgi:hypothetical protein